MPWLPGLDDQTYDGLEKGQKITLTLIAYLGSLCFTGLLVLSMHNVVQFLYKQSRWRVLPLLFFYVLSICDLLVRIYTLVWVINIDQNKTILWFYLPSVCKVMIGYTQCWAVTELTIRVAQCVYSLKSTGLSMSLDQAMDLQRRLLKYNTRVERVILALRIFSSVLIIASVATALILFASFDKIDLYLERLDKIKSLRHYFAWSSIGIVMLLIVSSLLLIVCLTKKENVMSDRLGKDGNVYASEKAKLATMSFVFGVSYLIDVLYDLFVIKHYATNEPDNFSFGWLVLE